MSAELHERLLAELDGYERAMPQPGNLIDALRAVVERHAPDVFVINGDVHAECTGCDEVDGVRAVHPCPDIQAIARELGVDGER